MKVSERKNLKDRIQLYPQASNLTPYTFHLLLPLPILLIFAVYEKGISNERHSAHWFFTPGELFWRYA